MIFRFEGLPRHFFVLLILGLFLTGCVAEKTSHYKDGLAYLEAKSYDKAVEKLEAAAVANPSNKKILKDLERAKKLAAEYHVQKGEEYSKKKELRASLFAFSKAKGYQPDNASYQKRYQEEEAKFNKVQAKIDEAVISAKEKNTWKDSIQTLESAKVYQSSFPELDKQISELKEDAAQYHDNRTDENLSMEIYPVAYEEIVFATNYSDDERYKNKKRAVHHLLMSRNAMEKGSYRLAYEEIEKGLQFQPDHPELKKYQKKLAGMWSDILYNEAMQANNSGNLALARGNLSQISRINPGFLDVEEQLSEIKGDLSAKYYEEAQRLSAMENREKIGTALAKYLLVREQHQSQYGDIDEKIADAKRLLLNEIEYRISFDFKNESGEPGAATYVKDQLLDRLKKSGLRNVKVLEREALDEILREQGLGQAFFDESTSIQVKKIKGIQTGIKGVVVRARVTETGRERPTYGTAKYKSGTRMLPNPEYSRLQMEVSTAQNKVVMANQKLSNEQMQANQSQMVGQQPGLAGGLIALGNSLSVAGAQEELNAAQAELTAAQIKFGNTPMQVEEAVYSDFRYEIYDLNLEGEAMITFRVIDFTTSEVGSVHTVKESDSITDRYIPGDPGKGIDADPNDLPSNEEFKKVLLAKAVDKTFAQLQDTLSNYSLTFYKKGIKAEENRLEKDAIENYIRFIYSAPDLSDARVQHANTYIYEKMGLLIIRTKSSS